MILGEIETPIRSAKALPRGKHYSGCLSALKAITEEVTPILKGEKNWSLLKTSETGISFADSKGSSMTMRVERGAVRIEIAVWDSKNFTAKSQCVKSSSAEVLREWVMPKLAELPARKTAPHKTTKASSNWSPYRPKAVAA